MKLYNKDELKDSRIFFDKNPPKFMTIFIVFMAIVLIFSIIASGYISKSYVIKALGVAETTDNHYVTVNVNGEVSEINKNEGEFVKKGDILFIINNGKSSDSQTNLAQPQIDKYKEKIAAINLFIKSLNDKVNYLANSGVEQAYYGKMEYYLSTANNEGYTNSVTQEQLNDAVKKLNKIKEELQKLEIQLTTATAEEKEEISSKIESKKEEIETQESQVKQQQQQVNDPSSQAKQIYQQMISEAGAEKTTTEEQITQLEGQKSSTEIEEGTKIVKANNDGYVHYLTPLKVGVPMQVNQTVAEISASEDDMLIVTANIMSYDISKVKIGQEVKVELQGVNSQKYGTLNGKLETITNGTLIQQTEQGDVTYYQCRVALNSTTLTASNGDTVSLEKSMPVEVRVIYNNETYLDWIKELLSFKN